MKTCLCLKSFSIKRHFVYSSISVQPEYSFTILNNKKAIAIDMYMQWLVPLCIVLAVWAHYSCVQGNLRYNLCRFLYNVRHLLKDRSWSSNNFPVKRRWLLFIRIVGGGWRFYTHPPNPLFSYKHIKTNRIRISVYY